MQRNNFFLGVINNTVSCYPWCNMLAVRHDVMGWP